MVLAVNYEFYDFERRYFITWYYDGIRKDYSVIGRVRAKSPGSRVLALGVLVILGSNPWF